MSQPSAARWLKLCAACCAALLAAAAVLGAWRGSRSGPRWLPAATAASRAGRTPEGASGAAAAGGRATGAQTPRGSSGRTSAGATAGPSAAAAEDPGSHSVLEGFGGAEPPEEAGAAAAKSSAAAVPGDTAVPPAADRLFGAPLPRAAIYGGGAAFEPEAYRRHYDDMAGSWATDRKLADHFAGYGRREGRVAQRLRVVLTYDAAALVEDDAGTAHGRVSDQLYSLIGTMAVALQLGAEMVLPEAILTGGKSGTRSAHAKGGGRPHSAPLDALFDVDRLLAWWTSVDAVLHRAPQPDGPIQVLVTGESICCLGTMENITDAIRGAVLDAVKARPVYIAEHPGRDSREALPAVTLRLQPPKLMFALRTNETHRELIEEVSRNVQPAPELRSAADAIVANLSAGVAAPTWDGLYLPLKLDARAARITGGDERVTDKYVEAMKAGNCTAPTPLYLASGLLALNKNASDSLAAMGSRLRRRGVCSNVVPGEQLRDSRRERLPLEALALVDLLVLTGARRFTGSATSPFTWAVREYRCLRGASSRSTAMVNTARESPDAAFEAAAALSDHSRSCPDA